MVSYGFNLGHLKILTGVCLSITDVGGSSGTGTACGASRYIVGQSANSKWWVPSYGFNLGHLVVNLLLTIRNS